jgi:hypothetical protein
VSAASTVVAVALAGFFVSLGAGKVLAVASMRKRAADVGYTLNAYRGIGALELAGAAGLPVGIAVVPLGAVAGAGLLLLLAGALATHVRSHHLDEHLSFEDRHVVPLLIEHLTAADRKLVTRRAWRVARPSQALFTVPWLLSPLDPSERAAVAAKVPFKGMTLAWRATRRRYNHLAEAALG